MLEKMEYGGDITKGGKCVGTSDNPYRIECIEDLVKLSQMAYNNETTDTYKYYLLVKDLDFNSIFSYSNYKAKYRYDETQKAYVPDENSETTIKELCTSGMGFIPIAQSYGSDGTVKTFRGTFYGKEQREIKNIYMNRSGGAGLFCGCHMAKIRNITVDGNIISTGSFAAGICGSGWFNTIENCINKAKIVSKTGVSAGFQTSGGRGNITNCINYGEIISERSSASGISNYFITLNKCRNFGNVTGVSASGISISTYGGDTGIMRNCFNAGTIISSSAGKIAGLVIDNNAKNMVYNSYNIGTLKNEGSSTPSIYGICGNSTTGKYAQNCYFAGTITTKDGANKSNCSMVMKCDEALTNCFYLEESATKSGIIPETCSKSFVKSSEDENLLTSQKVVNSFNEYIDNPDEGINTSLWLKWKVGENGLPELIYN